MEKEEIKLRECDHCGYYTETERFLHSRSSYLDTEVWLCKVCSGTFLGQVQGKRHQAVEDDLDELAKSLGYLFNYLFDKLNIDKSGIGETVQYDTDEEA